MKVFISWSGNTSREIAEALRDWLPNVLQVVDAWVSSEDIDKGGRWISELTRQLDGSRFGILCVTAENMAEPWLNFEAGALAKNFDAAHVSPFLVGLTPADLVGPISQFQATTATQQDVTRLVKTLNKASETRLPDERIARSSEVWWPILEKKLEAIRELPAMPAASTRDLREMVGEVLQVSRQIQRQMALDDLALEASENLDELLVEHIHTMLLAAGHEVKKFSYGRGPIILHTDQSLANELLDRIRSRAARVGRQLQIQPEGTFEWAKGGTSQTLFD